MKPYRVWFSAVGASQEPRRPWAVLTPGGELYLAAGVERIINGRTLFNDAAYMELPGGPRGIVEADGVSMLDATRWVQS